MIRHADVNASTTRYLTPCVSLSPRRSSHSPPPTVALCLQGFLSLLPVYLDHLLFPTLSDAAFLTEIHHVNADGMDAGAAAFGS